MINCDFLVIVGTATLVCRLYGGLARRIFGGFYAKFGSGGYAK